MTESFIGAEARKYIYKRFPNSSIKEKEKIITDWENKVETSNIVVKDFVGKVGNLFGKKVIDAGCGNGGTSIALALAGAIPFGVEIEKSLYEISKKHAEFYGLNLSFLMSDGVRLPFSASYFDHAVSFSVLEHTDDPIRYLNELLRVLKPGGVLYLGFPNKWWPRETHTGLWFLTYVPNFFRKFLVKFFNKGQLFENNVHFYSFFDLLDMIKKNKNNVGYRWVIVEDRGQSNNLIKKIIKFFLGLFGISYKSFLPHILVILKKEKNEPFC